MRGGAGLSDHDAAASQPERLAALLAAIALGLLANMMFVVVSRTALVTMPIMLAVFALLHLKCADRYHAFCVAAVLAAAGLERIAGSCARRPRRSFADYQNYKGLQINRRRDRVRGWNSGRNRCGFIAEAPVIGHGTGSTRGLFEQAAIGRESACRPNRRATRTIRP